MIRNVLKDLISRGIVNAEESEFIEDVGPYMVTDARGRLRGSKEWAAEFEYVVHKMIIMCYRDLSNSLKKNESEKTM